MPRKERRRKQRTPSNVPLDLYDPQGRAIIAEGRFINVSLTGSQLESRQPLHLNQRIRLQVQSPSRSAFDVGGKIIWRKKKSTGFKYGVQFERLSRPSVFARPSAPAYSHLHH